MQHLFMDLYSTGGATFLTIIDNFSKYAQAVPLNGTSSVHIAEALFDIFSILGTGLGQYIWQQSKKEMCSLHDLRFILPFHITLIRIHQ